MIALFILFMIFYTIGYIMLYNGLAREFEEKKKILRNIEYKIKDKENNNEHKSN